MRQQYSSYQECIDFFSEAQQKYPSIFRTEFIGTTWEDREILLVTLGANITKADEKPALFYTGTVHAREWIGIELAIAFATYVIEHINYNQQLCALLENATFYIVPCANPDGFEFSRNHFSFWRKNRRQNADGSFGVDLNRNFNVGYKANNNTNSNVYPGPKPFSEPETEAIRQFIESHENITIALDYHSQGNVFFPAHNFKHEDAIDATDLNVLSANMAEAIRKVSGREYGIHMGKPPASLISGSGREFYYSKGIKSLVVEVGTRNISDYQVYMQEHIDEHIKALIVALEEVPNYAKSNALLRVSDFVVSRVSAYEIELTWSYATDESIYFEIYRSENSKGFCQNANCVGTTKAQSFIDRHLKAATNYYYFIRAVSLTTGLKSPFAPFTALRTEPEINMFSKILYPIKSEIGYVSETSSMNKDHFGFNSLFVGYSKSKGECLGVATFSLDTVPENAIIKTAKVSFYPMNRVAAQVEKFGEWRIGLLDKSSVDDLYSFDALKQGNVLGYVDRPVKSHQLSQGVWRSFEFAKQERVILQNALNNREVTFIMEGPTKLPLEQTSQMMQWDIGFEKFSAGLNFRPYLELSYTLDEAHVELQSVKEMAISAQNLHNNVLQSGFTKEGSRIYGFMEFDLSHLPDADFTVISDAYIDLEAQLINANSTIRFHIELVAVSDGDVDFEHIAHRTRIERIGYDVSSDALKKEPQQRFIFDTLAIEEMVYALQTSKRLCFVIYASSSKPLCQDQVVEWMDAKRTLRPKLSIHYIKKRREGVGAVSNLQLVKENGMMKLTWENPTDSDFRGVIVVKNRFHVPSTPYDGQKLYGGSDTYTFDNFGALDIEKYYAVFTYDSVPNFSEPATIYYEPKEWQ